MFQARLCPLLVILLTFSPTALGNHIKPLHAGAPERMFTAEHAVEVAEDGKLEQSEFHQELQWRILNLLAQQLFDANHELLTSYLFISDRLYQTSTFSVNISNMSPDFLEVRITDSHGNDETRLEIPRLN